MARYANKISDHGEDVASEAWLYWMEKKGRDLRTEHEGTWKRVLRYQTRNYILKHFANRIKGVIHPTMVPLTVNGDHIEEDMFVTPNAVRLAHKFKTTSKYLNFVTVEPNQLNEQQVEERIEEIRNDLHEDLREAFEAYASDGNTVKFSLKAKQLKKQVTQLIYENVIPSSAGSPYHNRRGTHSNQNHRAH